MRNLKKVLSLVLALAMVLSICMVGAGAVNYDDFTDEENITKKQAVETLVSLDVIKGYNDGATFNPTGNVTRAEMATMICRILAGGDKMIPDATKPVPTYTDVRTNPSAAWAETYIEYCTSLGIVSGKGNGLFDPMANVTAAEAAKMVMTALGYNADIEGFKGIGWDINTMAKASTLKLTDNLVGEISANAPLTREQVAQMLFNALDDPMVQYYEGTNANVWIGAGNVNDKYYETILETKFNAEKVVGVVVANEYADLADTEPLAAGRTRVVVLGTDNEPVVPARELTVNLSTNLDKIGESIIVYRDKASNRIIFGDYQDTGLNKITEFTGKKEDITKGDGAVDKSARTAEQYVNFAEGVYSVYTASRTFTYSYVPEEGAEVVKVNVRKGTVLGENGVLSYGDLEWVYDAVNTDRPNDVVGFIPDDDSDNKMPKLTNAENENYANFEEWADTYLTVKDLKNGLNALENENGNYIKVVDYNSDGEIDYVLKTVYTASTVQRVSKDDEITLTNYETKGTINYIERDDKNADKIPVTEIEVVGDMPAAGDVVLYKVIDGTAYMQIAEMTTKKIDNVRRNTVTVETKDGDTYTQSGVNMIFRQDPMDDLAGTAEGSIDQRLSITQMRGNETYDIFFDLYGHIVAYRTAVNVGQYVLLTDGWYAQWKNNEEWSVKAYVDGKIDIFDLANNRSKFIDDNHDNSNTNDWTRLNKFWMYNNETYLDRNTEKEKVNLTNIASYSEDDDGKWTLTPVDTLNKTRKTRVIDLTNVKDDANTETIKNEIDGNKYLIGTAYDTTTPDSKDGHGVYTHTGADTELSYHNVTVRPRTDTVYYYVYKNADNGVDSVDMYTGYREAPKVKYEDINFMYAVATEYQSGSGVSEYYIANVIVVELNKTYSNGEPVFLIDGPDIVTNVSDDVYTVIRKDGKVEDIHIEKGSVDEDKPVAPKTFPIDKATGVDYNTGFLHGYTSSGWGNGLYMMFETRKEGVYSVRPMTTKEMKDNGFTIGIVAVYGGIYDGEYTAVHSVTGDELDGWTNNDGVFVKGIDQTMAEAYAEAEAMKIEAEGIKHVANVLDTICRNFKKDEEIRPNGASRGSYYTLDYTYDEKNKNPGEGNYHWNLRLDDDASYEEVMLDSFELNNGYVSYNMVLVKAEKNGDVVYAVNFEQERDYNRDNVMDKNLSVELWRSLVDRFNEAATSNKDKIEAAKKVLESDTATADQVAEQIKILKELKNDKDLSYKDGAEIDDVLEGLELKLAKLTAKNLVRKWADEARAAVSLTDEDQVTNTNAAVDAQNALIDACTTVAQVEAIIKAPAATPAALTLTAYTGTAVVPVAEGVVRDIVETYVVRKGAEPAAVKTVVDKIMVNVGLKGVGATEIVKAEAILESVTLTGTDASSTLTVPVKPATGGEDNAQVSDLDTAINGATAYTMAVTGSNLAGTTLASSSNKLIVWQKAGNYDIKLAAGNITEKTTTLYLTNSDTSDDAVYVLTLKNEGGEAVWTSADITVPKKADGVDGKSDLVTVTLPEAGETYTLYGETKATTGAKVTLTLAANGTIKLDGTTAIDATSGAAIENLLPGATVKFTVEPAEGYEVASVAVTSPSITLKPDKDGMYTFTKDNSGTAQAVTVTMRTIAEGKIAEATENLTGFTLTELTPYEAAPTVTAVKEIIADTVLKAAKGTSARAGEETPAGWSAEVTEGITDTAFNSMTENSAVELTSVKVVITYNDGITTPATKDVTLASVKVYWVFKAAEAESKLKAAIDTELAKLDMTAAQATSATAVQNAVKELIEAVADPTTADETVVAKDIVATPNDADNEGAFKAGDVNVTYTVTYNGTDYDLTGKVTIKA